MEIYSLKDIESLVLNSELLQTKKSKEQQNLLLDKHNYILDLIISKNLASDKPFYYYSNINSVVLKKNLGDRYYLQILDNLEEIGIIEKNDSYSRSKFSKSYCIPKSLIKNHPPIKVLLKSNRFILKLNQLIEKEFIEINKDSLYHKILLNTSRLKLLPEFSYYIPTPEIVSFWENNYGQLINEYEDNSAKMFRYTEFSNSLKRFNENTSLENIYSDRMFYKPIRVSSGRVYHMVASIPRLIRHCLRSKQNELLYEIDMASAQPSILILEYLRDLKLNRRDIGSNELIEAQKCLKLLLEGKIYSYIQQNSKHYKELPYKDLKTSILTTLNAEINNSIYNKELLKIFPYFMDWVNKIKKAEGYKRISTIGQTAEANIFVSVYQSINPEILALIIHDCILTTKENTIGIKTLLMNKVKELYSEVINNETDLNNLFKTDIVSLRDEELPSYQENEFSKNEMKRRKNN